MYIHKSNILLTFLKKDEKGDFKKSTVTLANVRLDLTAAEIKQVAAAFASLIMHTLDELELVQYSYVS